MKKLAALASIALLLCASASFAKKAMDEEEMDLVTAAGQPSVIDINVEANGHAQEVKSDTKVNNFVSASTTSGTVTSNGAGGTGINGDLALDVNNLTFPPLDIQSGDLALRINFADSDIESFTLSGISSLTATASTETETDITIGAAANVVANHDDQSNTSLLVNSGSQSNLRAVTLNNVAGENQVASAVNILAGANNASGSQANTINQSWGSTYDWSFAPGLAPSAGGAGGTATVETMAGSCVFGPCNVAEAKGGDGKPGFDNTPLTITADKITRVEAESGHGDVFVDVSELDKALVSAVIDTDSQNNLAALLVNNIVGRNQVASGLNVASNGAAVIGNSAGLALVVFDGVQQGQASFNQTQSNTINQYRGTPLQQ